MGPLLHSQSQLQYFDLVSLLPTECVSTPTRKRESAVSALFGASFVSRLEQTVLCLVNAEATNVEVLKVRCRRETLPQLCVDT